MIPASPIHLLERDYFLRFDQHQIWPPPDLQLLHANGHGREKAKEGVWIAGPWQREELKDRAGGYLWRKLEREGTDLREAVLRFPSAPLFGTQSKTDYQVRMEAVHQHTMRLLTSGRAGRKTQIKKVFLILNGLNEIDYFEFYYDLAGLLIRNAAEGADVACLISPFPGHLTRYPLIGRYAEKPLQRFITDPSDLFRQYLRFMVEMQWLLSALVPVSYYPVTCGVPLLKEDENPNGGRSKPEILGKAIHDAWKAIYARSPKRGSEIVESDVHQSIAVLRKLIGWKPSPTKLADRDKKEPLDPPQVHVIGYSLGGYLAQSIFFTWPFAIGSCTTICSGGALNQLRPEKIMHEEEWRAITHGLKYEVESGILEGRISLDNRNDPQSVCGIPVSYFTSHFQTFNDIFLQDPQGSYRHRVTEFAPRLFFVVGGNDPIVPTRAVLDASPPEGINMIEIARLSHFVAKDGGEWPKFWLPTIASIISSLAEHSETLLRTTMLENLWDEETTDSASGSWLHTDGTDEPRADKALLRREKAERRDSEPLDSDRLQTAILQLVDRLKKNGVLLILRNQIPVTLMGQRVLHRRGSVPHYADFEIRRFWERLQEQRLCMLKSVERITIVVPGRLNDWLDQRPSILSVKHLPVVREFPDRQQQRRIWEDFLGDWEKDGALYRFNPEYPKDISADRFKLERMIREDTATPPHHWVLTCLPDVWISLSERAVTRLVGVNEGREYLHKTLIDFMTRIHSGKREKKWMLSGSGKEPADTDLLREWLENRDLQMIRISAAQSSPRFLGEWIRKPEVVIDFLTHSALALARSQPCMNKNDFKNGWDRETRENEKPSVPRRGR